MEEPRAEEVVGVETKARSLLGTSPPVWLEEGVKSKSGQR